MEITIQSKFSDKIGTHYGLYLDSLLIHYESSRAAAKEIKNKIVSGDTLYEIIYSQINKECARKNESETKQLQTQIISQNKEIERLKKTINDLEEKHSNKCESFNSEALRHKHSLSLKEAEELQTILTDMEALNFSWSNELSKHITDNNLQEKYPHISGVVKMKKRDKEWDFEGGFPNNIYRIICEELNLQNQNTTAKAIGFKPYKGAA